MKKVRLLYSKSLKEQTGASTVMRLHANNVDYYLNKGILFSVYTRDNFLKSDSNSFIEGQSCKSRIKQKLDSILSLYYRKSPILGFLMEYLRNIHPAELFINNMPIVNDDDILFFNELYTCYCYLKKIGKNNNKIVLVIHNDGYDFHDLCDKIDGFKESWIFKQMLKRYHEVLKSVDRIGFVSQFATENFINNHPDIDSQKVFYVLNGMELTHTPKTVADNYEVVCVGSVNDRKRQETIVRALINCKQEKIDLSDIHFTIVGSGDKLDYLMQLSTDNGIDDYITFTGGTTDVNKYLEKAKIFILPSSNEGMPMAILEAMRMSLPIVSTRTGEIPNMIVNGKSGLLINSTTEDVYRFIKDVKNYDWDTMGKVSYDIFKEKYSVEHMLDSYINVFNSI